MKVLVRPVFSDRRRRGGGDVAVVMVVARHLTPVAGGNCLQNAARIMYVVYQQVSPGFSSISSPDILLLLYWRSWVETLCAGGG